MYKSDVEGLEAFVKSYKDLKNEISKVIVGQDEVVNQVFDLVVLKLNLAVK